VEQHEVNSEVQDNAKSNPYTPTHAQSNFDDAEFISTPMNPNTTLLENQYPCGTTKITKIKNLLYQEGIGPLVHTPKPHTTLSITVDVITPKICEEPPHIRINLEEGEKLAGSTQESMPRAGHPRTLRNAIYEAYKGKGPIVEARPIPGTPRKGTVTTTMMKAGGVDAAMVGMQMRTRGPLDPFWEMFSEQLR
jgi:hypothetical protein